MKDSGRPVSSMLKTQQTTGGIRNHKRTYSKDSKQAITGPGTVGHEIEGEHAQQAQLKGQYPASHVCPGLGVLPQEQKWREASVLALKLLRDPAPRPPLERRQSTPRGCVQGRVRGLGTVGCGHH